MHRCLGRFFQGRLGLLTPLAEGHIPSLEAQSINLSFSTAEIVVYVHKSTAERSPNLTDKALQK